MKSCPRCNQTFDGATDFCVDDGTPLEVDRSFVSADVPTQVFTPVPTKTDSRTETGKLIYVAVGVMATAIIALVAFLMYLPSDEKNRPTNQNPALHTSLKPEWISTSQANIQTASETPSISTITETVATDLVIRWKNAQNWKSFSEYRACYAPTTEFVGIKRTPTGGREQLSFNSWMNDRGRMLRNVVDVQADIRNIAIDGDTAVAVFTQKWRSVNHCDIGEKTLRIKMFADGPKIVFEELKDPVSCG